MEKALFKGIKEVSLWKWLFLSGFPFGTGSLVLVLGTGGLSKVLVAYLKGPFAKGFPFCFQKGSL